jgi:hypothetical protein
LPSASSITGTLTIRAPHAWHSWAFTRVLKGEISISPSFSWMRTWIVPTGQMAAHAPQPMQSSAGWRNGALTTRSLPRPANPMAARPMISSHTAVHNPHRMQSRWVLLTWGYGVPVTPMRSARALRGLLSGARASSNSMTPRRACTARSLETLTTMSRRTG